MNKIYIFKDGKTMPAKIERLFGTHGPYTIEGKRLDFLTRVQVLVDSSKTSTHQSGTSTSKANTDSMLGRAVVGGVLTGGAGAIIGGLSGKRESDINTMSSETLHTELTAELIFEGGNFMYVLVKSMESFHWLLGFTSQRPWTDGELEVEKNKALNARFEIQLDEAHQEAISVTDYPKSTNKEAVKKAEAEILEATFKILQNTPDVARALDYSEFVNVYQNTFPQRNIELNKQVIDYSDQYSGSGRKMLIWIAIPLILIYAVWVLSSNESTGGVGDNGKQISVPIQASGSTNISKHTESKERVITEDLDIRNGLAFIPNEDKPFTGRYETYNLNGSIRAVAHLKDGKFNGLMTWWLGNGEKIKEVNYKDGEEWHQNIEKREKENANTQGGFASFHAEAEKAKNKLACPNSVETDITPPSFDGDGSLYGCIRGQMETVKWFVNEIPNSNRRVNNIKFIWNDWFNDAGYGLHPDRQEAQKALNVLIKLYAPDKAKELNKIFFGSRDKSVTSGSFNFKYTYIRGPAIDERMIVVTENNFKENISLSSQLLPAKNQEINTTAKMQEVLDQLKTVPTSYKEDEKRKENIEKADEAHSTPERFLKIVKFSWHKNAFGPLVIANFVIKNISSINIKDISIRCEFSAPSGTIVGHSENTIYEIVVRDSTKTFENIDLGFIDPQASKGGCVIINATGI